MYVTPETNPLAFPLGQLCTTPQRIGLGLTAGQSKTLFEAAPGTRGIIRNIAWITSAYNPGTLVAQLPGLLFEIFYDGNTVADISLPILTLLAMENADKGLPLAQFRTGALEYSSGPWKDLTRATVGGSCGNLRLPIPFTNGIKIAVRVPGTETNTQEIFGNILWQTELPECWNENLRLFAPRSNENVALGIMANTVKLTAADTLTRVSAGNFNAGIVAGMAIFADGVSAHDMLITERVSNTVLRVNPRDTEQATFNVDNPDAYALRPHVFLNRPAGKEGYIASMVASFKANASALAGDMLFEANPRIFLNGNTLPDLAWTSIEDFLNGCYYFDQESRGDEGGIVSWESGSGKASGYKDFTKYPIRYTNGVRATVPCYEMSGGTVTFNWTTFHYERV